ncbi:glycoside hydrolase family 3 protein [Glycomyces salinus]|uniref:glycoside hydrolase family 3 protein n=1 Tax=Glycomyces salinus TaxID=980294 RepID=UPI0027DA399E|nr:glycoside hydrolase family 3 N-terminal domain-containing protein [Glycomyces salinus]
MRIPTLRRKTVLASGLAGAAAAMAGCSPDSDDDGTVDRREQNIDGREAYVEDQLASMSLEDKVGQLFMVYVNGSAADTDDPDHVAANQDHLGVDNGAELIERYRPGGVIYFGWAGNVDEPEQIARLSNGLIEAAGDAVPPLIATDQEYGVVTRIGEPVTQFPGAMPLGATGDAEAAENAARIAGAELRAMGLSQNFAPDADVNVNPANPVIGVRSFSSDPELAAELTAAQVRGYSSGGVAACAKHFPGHGDTDVDSHVGLPSITHTEREWTRIDAPPFEAAIEAGADMIMSAHIQFPALDDSLKPATLSEPILTGLLRERLGFTGVVVTDSLEMEGVRSEYGDERVPVMALQAGADLLLMPPDFGLARQAVLDAVESGELTEERLDASVERLLDLKYRLGLIEEGGVDSEGVLETVGTDEHREAAADIGDRAITLLRNDGTLPVPAEGLNVLVTGWGENTTAVIADSLGELGASADAMPTGDEPDSAAIGNAAAAAEGRDLVVVATFNVGADSPQTELVRSLQATGVPVVAAAVGTPYDIARFTDVNAYLASYSYTDGSLSSLAKVIVGELEPSGSLPVDIPAGDDPDSVLFELGSGDGF